MNFGQYFDETIFFSKMKKVLPKLLNNFKVASHFCVYGVMLDSYSTYSERRSASETAVEFALLSFSSL